MGILPKKKVVRTSLLIQNFCKANAPSLIILSGLETFRNQTNHTKKESYPGKFQSITSPLRKKRVQATNNNHPLERPQRIHPPRWHDWVFVGWPVSFRKKNDDEGCQGRPVSETVDINSMWIYHASVLQVTWMVGTKKKNMFKNKVYTSSNFRMVILEFHCHVDLPEGLNLYWMCCFVGILIHRSTRVECWWTSCYREGHFSCSSTYFR